GEWPEEQKGNLPREQLDKLWEILSGGTTLASGTRLVLFGEVNSKNPAEEKFSERSSSRPNASEPNFQTNAPSAKFSERPDAEELEWRQATEALMQRLPERVGFVFSGAPENFHLPTSDPHFLEINLPEEGSGDEPTASERLYKYKLPPIHSDRAAREDRLGINAYAEALGRFVLHPQTQAPLTIGIHGPWGKGKSSFMELIDIVLVKWANVNRSTRMQTLADLQTAIEQKQAEAEVAGEKELAQITSDLTSAINLRESLWQDMQRAAQKELLTVRFNAWQFEDFAGDQSHPRQQRVFRFSRHGYGDDSSGDSRALSPESGGRAFAR
ncbi:MAG: P-loop NTPase fold protein, partial [bacterium]